MPPISPDQVYDTLRHIKDPEIPINVVDLGLIHDVTTNQRGITITMILTTRFCPYQGSLVKSVREAVEKVAQGTHVEVIIGYSTTWSLSDLTPEGIRAWEQFFGGDKKE